MFFFSPFPLLMYRWRWYSLAVNGNLFRFWVSGYIHTIIRLVSVCENKMPDIFNMPLQYLCSANVNEQIQLSSSSVDSFFFYSRNKYNEAKKQPKRHRITIWVFCVHLQLTEKYTEKRMEWLQVEMYQFKWKKKERGNKRMMKKDENVSTDLRVERKSEW